MQVTNPKGQSLHNSIPWKDGKFMSTGPISLLFIATVENV